MQTFCRDVARGLSWLALLFLLATCGGGGGGGSEPAPPPTMVSGLVRAPGGQVAFHRQPEPLQRLAEMFAASAYAAVSGLASVPDGTVVELGRIDVAGRVTRLGTATTTGGRYSFNLTSLGLVVSSDLVVRVANAGTGAQMRAFVSGSTADIDPVSEAAVRMLLTQLAASAAALNDFTVQEQRDLMTALELLLANIQVATGPAIETAVTAIQQLAAANTGLVNFLAAAAGAGQTQEGPGDTGNHYPLTPGDVRQFQATRVETGQPAVSFVASSRVTGTRVLGALTAIVLANNNVVGRGLETEEFLVRDGAGVTSHGSNDATDTLTPQLAPIRLIRFPLRAETTFESVNRTGLNFGDIDGDGLAETASLNAQVTVVGFESVTTPVGVFANSAKIETRATTTVRVSSIAALVTLTTVQTEWLAPQVGPVRIQTLTSAEGVSETVTAELSGYFVNGQGKGAVPLTVATGLSNADSNETNPGRPGLATDGTNYLAVSCRELGAPAGLVGVFVAGASAGAPFPIAAGDCSSLGGTSENSISQPSVGFDGTNYLVVFVKGAIIRGTRVSRTGTVLDGPDGFAISTGQLFSISSTAPALAFDGANYLVVWRKFIPVSGAGTWNVFGARVSPGGQVSGEIAIAAEQNTPDQLGFALSLGAPSVAFDGSNHLVVWGKERTGPGTSIYSDLFAVYLDVGAARITPLGNLLDPQGILVATSGPFAQTPGSANVQVAFDGTNHLAVWRRANGSDPAAAQIVGSRIQPDGTLPDAPAAAGAAIVINAAALAKGEPALEFDGSDFLVAWVVGDFANSPPAGLFGAKVRDGQVVAGPPSTTGIALSQPPPPNTRLRWPVLRANGTSLMLAWLDNIELAGQNKSISGTLIFH